MILMMIAPMKAVRKLLKMPPSRLNVPLNQTVNINIAVLITRVNSPSVTTLIGRVNSLITGRITALTRPNIMATMIKLKTLPLKVKFDRIRLVSQMAKALIRIRNINFKVSSPRGIGLEWLPNAGY
jgi:hypothetical protein